jgi:hypothetical protein
VIAPVPLDPEELLDDVEVDVEDEVEVDVDVEEEVEVDVDVEEEVVGEQ